RQGNSRLSIAELGCARIQDERKAIVNVSNREHLTGEPEENVIRSERDPGRSPGLGLRRSLRLSLDRHPSPPVTIFDVPSRARRQRAFHPSRKVRLSRTATGTARPFARG